MNSRLVLAVALAGILVVAAFTILPGMLGGGNTEPVPESEALELPVSMSLVYTETERSYNTLDGSYLQVQENIVDSRRHCEFCTAIEFRQGSSADALDVSWSALRNFNIDGAKKVTFYAMGDEGGESVVFKGAGKRVDTLLNGKLASLLDFDVRTEPVKLTDEWKKFEVDLSDANLRGVTNPFGIGIDDGQNTGPVRIFVKGMMLEDKPATDPVPLAEAQQ